MTPADLTELEALLSDRWERLTSGKLYKIKTADGRGIIPFKPREEQKDLLRKLCAAHDKVRNRAEKIKRLGIDPDQAEAFTPPQDVELKSRRLGYSTTLGIFVADVLAFCKNQTCQLIDQTADDAAKKMNNIVKVAIDSLIDAGWPLKKIKDNDGELTIALDFEGVEPAPSTFYAGTKARGGSIDFLWCSELGVIQFEDPPRCDEIITGAFPAARHGIKVVETTWKGGKGGKLWDIIEPTLNGIADDWNVNFTPWFVDPRNRSATAVIDARTQKYFAEIKPRLDKAGITITEEQMRWYSAEWRTVGVFMKRENPTFLDECWNAAIEGAIFGECIEEARTEGRIGPWPVDGRAVVHTAWDLGSSKNTVVWYFQCLPFGRIRLIDCDYGLQLTLPKRIAYMQAKGYHYGKHYLPHDANQDKSGLTFYQDMLNNGVKNCVVVPCIPNKWDGIDHVIRLFPSLEIRLPTCQRGLEGLESYRRQPDGKGGRIHDEPLHDWASHIADGLRTMAEAEQRGLIDTGGTTTTSTWEPIRVMAGAR